MFILIKSLIPKVEETNLLEVVSCLNVVLQLPVLLSIFVDDLHSEVFCKQINKIKEDYRNLTITGK